VLETSNRHWAARPATLEACTNRLDIADDWQLASAQCEAFAREQGWWGGGARLDVAAAYRNPHIPGHLTAGRTRRARALLEAGRGRHDVGSFERLLRDHGDGGAAWSGADADPGEERYFTLCAHSEPVQWTTASLVARLPADRRAPWPVWISFATPCTGIFLPVYTEGTIPAVFARGDADEAPAGESAWWAFKRLQDAVAAEPRRLTPMAREAWGELEVRIEGERAIAEAKAHAAARAGDRDAASDVLTGFMRAVACEAVERAEALARQLR
jgi:dipeptidase